MTTSQAQTPSLPSSEEMFQKHNKKMDRVIMGATLAAGTTGIVSLSQEMAQDGMALTPANLEIKPLGMDGLMVGLGVVIMACAFKRHVSKDKSDAVLKENEKQIFKHGTLQEKILFAQLREKVEDYQKLARHKFSKSRNRFLVGLGLAVGASALSVGAAVITPAVAVLTGASIIVGVSGFKPFIEVGSLGKMRDEAISKTSTIKHTISRRNPQ